MTRDDFSKWIEEHYHELLAVARRRTERLDLARDVVQDAVARALGSPTLGDLPTEAAWPWMADAVRSTVEHARRGERRASRARAEWAGAFLDEQGRANRGRRAGHVFTDSDDVVQKNPSLWGKRGRGQLIRFDPYQNDDDQGHDFVGPRGAWKGEYTVAHLGKCSCGGELYSRLEIGRDREKHNYSRKGAVEALYALELAVKDEPRGSIARLAAYAVGVLVATPPDHEVWHEAQVLGCSNGHRVYTGVR